MSVPFDDGLAEQAAYLRRVYSLSLPDAGVAVTAMSKNLPLVTRDSDFKDISELEVVDL